MLVLSCSSVVCFQLPVAEEVEVSVDVFSRVLNASSRLDANATLCPLFRLMQVGRSFGLHIMLTTHCRATRRCETKEASSTLMPSSRAA